MRRKDSKKPTLSELKKWAESREFSEEPLQLDKATKVLNRKRFFKQHVFLLESKAKQSNRWRFMPYFNRLVEFKRLIEEEERAAQ